MHHTSAGTDHSGAARRFLAERICLHILVKSCYACSMAGGGLMPSSSSSSSSSAACMYASRLSAHGVTCACRPPCCGGSAALALTASTVGAVLAMVLYDFCYYWLHRMGHERTILWASHVAHHQSEDYNLTTALRQTSTGFLLGWIFYIPMYVLGIPAEVVVTVGSINLIYQFWVHTEHIPKLGWYEWFFVTPSNHRVHHAQNDCYLDRNYGGLFIIWDRLFGTFQEELETEPVVFGIRGPLKSWSPVKALTHIYVDMGRDSWRTARWQDKLHVWVSRTGWRPADVATRFPREKNDLPHFERFDPKVPRRVSIYGFFQMLPAAAIIARLSMVRMLQFLHLDPMPPISKYKGLSLKIPHI